jgi:hypothetical protein
MKTPGREWAGSNPTSARARHSSHSTQGVEDVLAVSSVTVYTPEQLRHIALRPSHLPSPRMAIANEEMEAAPLRAQTLAKFMAGGFLATVVLFAGFLAIANATDDTLSTPKDRSYTSKPVTTSSAQIGIGRSVLPSAATAVATNIAPPSDFELPDDGVPAQRTAVKGRTPKQGKRSIGPRF